MPVGEYIRSTTHREHLGWLAWMEKELNNPDRLCWYLMQIAAEVLRSNVKHPERVKIDDMKLSFAERKNAKLTPEQVKQVWMARVGYRSGSRDGA